MKLIHVNDVLSIPRIINATFGLPVRSIARAIDLHRYVAGTRSIEREIYPWADRVSNKGKKRWQKLRRDYWRIRGSPDFKRRGNNAPRTLVRSRPFLSTPVSGVVAWPEWSFNYVARLPLIRHSTSSTSAPRESREIASPFFPPTIGLLATPCRRMERKRARKETWEKEGGRRRKKREKKTVGWVGELAK